MISGVGLVCSAGFKVKDVWERILARESALSEISQWNASEWPVKMAGEATQLTSNQLVADRKLHKMISRSDLFGLYAADQAIENSGFLKTREGLDESETRSFNDRSGVFVGSGGGTYQSQYDFVDLIRATGQDMKEFGREAGSYVSPMWLLKNLPNNVVCHVGIRHGLKGPNACITNQCVSGSLAIADAVAAIREGEADRAVVAAHDVPVEPEMVSNYYALGLLSNDDLRPFDGSRSGTVLAEGAASVVLEAHEDAQARGAKIWGSVLGFGCTTEATGLLPLREDGDGVERAIQIALQEAAVDPCDIGFIVAHGNGSKASDSSESAALSRVFGNDTPVTAFKGCYGHTIAGSGLIDTVLALKALEMGLVPGIVGLNHLDESLPPLAYAESVVSPKVGNKGKLALMICRGFGGINTAMVLRGA